MDYLLGDDTVFVLIHDAESLLEFLNGLLVELGGFGSGTSFAPTSGLLLLLGCFLGLQIYDFSWGDKKIFVESDSKKFYENCFLHCCLHTPLRLKESRCLRKNWICWGVSFCVGSHFPLTVKIKNLSM